MERTSIGNTRMVTLENLQLGTMYQVRVRAVSDLGDGAWSDTVSMTTFNGKFISDYYGYISTHICTCLAAEVIQSIL